MVERGVVPSIVQQTNAKLYFQGACRSPSGPRGAAKHWTATREEHDGAFFENGEYFPFAIDTTQESYYAAVRIE